MFTASQIPNGDSGHREFGSRYVVITPARNEAGFITRCLDSMVAQTIRPLRWVIVSDGSTDGTDELVARYAAAHPWILLIRMAERRERNFAGKVHAFNAGFDNVRSLEFDAIASLDADITFEPDYFAFLLGQLASNPALGLVGTPFAEDGRTYDYRFVSLEHVSGACQLFRRECFEQIGGYVAIEGGGVDHVAVLKARMSGWRTRTFTDHVCHHHRKQGSAMHGVLRAKFRVGRLDYALGAHPIWEAFRGIYQISKRPYFFGSAMIMAGYLWSLVRQAHRPIPDELVRFRRGEQMCRLKAFFMPHSSR
jgi:poly-beta-1,6-N-acetyl-D-glucosamine synthase